jgi:hypothetical protein
MLPASSPALDGSRLPARRLLPLLLAVSAACTVERPPPPDTNPIVAFRRESGFDFADCGVLRYSADIRCPGERDAILACIEAARATCAPVHWVVERAAGGFASVDHFFVLPLPDASSCGYVTFTDSEEASCRFFVRQDCASYVVPDGCGPPALRDCGDPVRLGGAGCESDEV